MQHHHEDRELDAAIARFLARQADQTNQPTAEELRNCAKSFGAYYTVVDIREGLRFRLAGVLEQAGILECHIDTYRQDGGLSRVFQYRRRSAQIARVAA